MKAEDNGPQLEWCQVLRKSDSMVYREVAGESMLIPIRGHLAKMQQLFVLNRVGAHIWRLLDGRNDLETIHRSLVETFEVSSEEAGADLLEYVNTLRAAGLVQEAEPAAGPPDAR